MRAFTLSLCVDAVGKWCGITLIYISVDYVRSQMDMHKHAHAHTHTHMMILQASGKLRDMFTENNSNAGEAGQTSDSASAILLTWQMWGQAVWILFICTSNMSHIRTSEGFAVSTTSDLLPSLLNVKRKSLFATWFWTPQIDRRLLVAGRSNWQGHNCDARSTAVSSSMGGRLQ